RKGRAIHAAYYAFGGGVIALWSLLLATLRGIQQPESAVAIYAIYGVCGLIMNVRWRRPLITSLALALLTGSTLWALRWRHVDLKLTRLEDAPLWGAVLAVESLIMGLIAAVLAWTRPDQVGTTTEDLTSSVLRWQDAYQKP